MKPLSICICYLASLYACFKAIKILDAVSAFAISCAIGSMCVWVVLKICEREK